MEGGIKMFANILAFIGAALSGMSTTASYLAMYDEPECPESLLD